MSRPEWEYKFVRRVHESQVKTELDIAGDNGWELVTAVHAVTNSKPSENFDLIFKRLKE